MSEAKRHSFLLHKMLDFFPICHIFSAIKKPFTNLHKNTKAHNSQIKAQTLNPVKHSIIHKEYSNKKIPQKKKVKNRGPTTYNRGRKGSKSRPILLNSFLSNPSIGIGIETVGKMWVVSVGGNPRRCKTGSGVSVVELSSNVLVLGISSNSISRRIIIRRV